MPIRPEHVFLYPIDWPQLWRHVRFVRARGACEHCGRPMGIGYSTSATGDGGTGSGIAGVTAKVDACDGRERTSSCKVPGLRWCWLVRT